MNSITETRESKKRKVEFHGEIKVKGVPRVSLLRRRGFNKEEMWDSEDQRVDM